ncbi:hypothetical protein scyTo_0007962 [Scyliorhinus torazame]|uniref:Uncharacterized protein n=1 Tax=Scyliorhinus torazame TaxID=75743 RepID=A0A401P1A7_SCYTO|nr:hypothetical protein [Scyliorhinus torazame]
MNQVKVGVLLCYKDRNKLYPSKHRLGSYGNQNFTELSRPLTISHQAKVGVTLVCLFRSRSTEDFKQQCDKYLILRLIAS